MVNLHDQLDTGHKSRHRNRCMVQWAFFSEPGHVILHNLLANIVDVMKLEFVKKTIISDTMRSNHDMVVCITGNNNDNQLYTMVLVMYCINH